MSGDKNNTTFFKKAVFAFIALLIFFGGAEGIFRFFHLNVLSGDEGRSDRLLYFAISDSENNMDENLVLGVRLMPLDPNFYRIPYPIRPKEPGTFRVVCLGDSSTIGDGVLPHQAYCYQLGQILTEKMPDKKVEALNLGFYGYSSYQGRMLLEQNRELLLADAVIFYFGANDMDFAPVREDKKWDTVPIWALHTNKALYTHSYFYRFLRNVNVRYLLQIFVHPFNSQARNHQFRARVTRDDFYDNLKAIESTTQKSGGKVYIVPYLSMTNGQLTLAPYLHHFSHERMIDHMSAFSESIKNDHTPFVDFVHPDPAGHRIIAEHLAEKILQDNQSQTPAQN